MNQLLSGDSGHGIPVKCTDADADAQYSYWTGDVRPPCRQDRRANRFSHLNGAGQFGIGKQHTELLAAVAPSDVSWPTDVLKNALCDRSERTVSRNVPVVAIEVLEVIDVYPRAGRTSKARANLVIGIYPSFNFFC